METIEKQVRRARRRLALASLAGKLAWCWFATLLLAAVAIGVGRLWLAVDPQMWTLAWLAAALAWGFAAAVVWTWFARQDALQAAVEIDRRFGLKERVSSTLALAPAERESPIGQALVRDAIERVERVNLAEQFRLRLDRRAWLPAVAATIAFAAATLLPVRAPQAPAKATAHETQQVRQSTKALVKRLDAKRKQAAEKGLSEIDPLLAKLEDGARKLAESSENDRKKTLLALNDLAQDAAKRREKLAGSAEMKKQLEGLKNLDQGPADKISQALAAGDLDKAAKEIEKLKQDLADKKLDPQAQKALAKQLDQLHEALERRVAAHEKKEAELKEQIEAERRAGNTAQADKLQQQLDKMAAQKPQMGQLGQMKQQIEQAARAMSQGDCEKASQALAELGDQLGGLEQELQEMEMLDDALDQLTECKKSMACKECNGDGCGACQGDEWVKRDGPLDPTRRSKGGGRGIGVGLGPGLGPSTDPKGKFYDSTVKQQPGRGPAQVVGEAVGPNRKGRVLAEIQTEFSGGPQDAADALSQQRLPHDYRDHAQRYFDALREGSGGDAAAEP
jgi:hypothetical protein